MTSPLEMIKRIHRGFKLLGPKVTVQAGMYPLRKAYHTARFDERGQPLGVWRSLAGTLDLLLTPPQRQPPPMEHFSWPGDLQEHRATKRHVDLRLEGGWLRLIPLAPDTWCVRFDPQGIFEKPFSYAIAKPAEQWPIPEYTLVDSPETPEFMDIQTQRMICRIQRRPCRITFLDLDGRVISEDSAGIGFRAPWVGCWRHLDEGEHIYGLGEKTRGLDHRGQWYEMWNTDPQTYAPGDDPLYMSFPIYVGLREGRGYGIFFDNNYRSFFDIGHWNPSELSFVAEGGELRYYFFYGPSLAQVLNRYTELTGRMPLPPLWALGYHQSRWSYYPEARVRQIADEFRSRQIPCDAIHLDIHYMDGYRVFTWDRQRFPDPARLIFDLADKGFKTVVLIDAGVKVDRHYHACADGLKRDAFITYPDGRLFSGPVWPGDCYFPDFTAPEVRQWWGDLHADLTRQGIAGVWNDMNEPVITAAKGDCPPDHVQHAMDGLGGDHRQAHNIYGMQMARATTEGIRRLKPGHRHFVISRSGYPGIQRYALGWTGDNESTWESMALGIPMVLNLGMSGLAFAGADTGGFEGTADGELLTRWIQLGVFSPLFRNHTALLSGDQEPWSAGEPFTSINRRYIELRYQLLPVIYTAFWQCAESGIPVMRPLLMDWQDDERTHRLEDQFMFGDHLLVAPVLRAGSTQRSVYLPAGDWYHWWSDEALIGPADITADAPLEIMPLYVRAGAVVPLIDVQQYVGEKPCGRVTLHIFAGNGKTQMYEDAGDGWEHLHGFCRHTTFVTTSDGKTLHVQRRVKGNFEGGVNEFAFVIHGLAGRAARVEVDGDPAHVSITGEPTRVGFQVDQGFESVTIHGSD